MYIYIKLSKPKLPLASVLIYKIFSNPAESKCFYALTAKYICASLHSSYPM